MRNTLLAAFLLSATAWPQARPLTILPAASMSSPSIVAPESIGAARAEAESITVTDALGSTRPAQLLSVSPVQTNFVIPAGTAPGNATVTLRGRDGSTATGTVEVRAVAPGIFTLDGSGRGKAASTVPFPIDLAAEAGPVNLQLFGTGMRGSRQSVTATIGGEAVPVIGGIQPGAVAGLDLLELGPLPQSLRDRDEAAVAVTVDGAAANRVTIPILSAPAAGQWGRRPELPEANSEMSVAELDGKIYVLGGYPSSRISVRTVQVYDPVSATWSLTTPLPVALNHTMSVSVNGRIYMTGGQRDAGGAGPFENTVYEYDPGSATWTARAPMPSARGGGAAAVVDGKIYVAGGRPPRGSDFAVYDPAANSWTVLPDMPTQRNHLGTVAVGNKVYVVGGRFGAGFESERTERIEIFDTVSRTWTSGAAMPRPRGGVNAVEALGCIHVFGGEGNNDIPSGVFPDHDVYDPRTDTWTQLEPMPIPVHGVTGAVFTNGLIYLPGGGISIGGSSGSTFHQVHRPAMDCR